MAIFLGAKPASTGGSGGRGRAVAPAPAQLRQQAAQQTAMLVGPQLIEAIEQYTAQAIRQRQMPVLEQNRIRLKLLVAQRQGELNHHRQRRGLTPPPESYQEYDQQQGEGEGEEPEQSEAPMPITATAGAALDQPQQIADDEGEWDNPELEEGEEVEEIEEVAPEPEPGMVYRPYNEGVPAQTNFETLSQAAAPLEDTIVPTTHNPQPQTPSPLAGTGSGSTWAWSGPGQGPRGFAPPPQLTTAGLFGSELPQPPAPPATATRANWLNQATTPNPNPAQAQNPAPNLVGPQGFGSLVPPPPPILSIQPPPPLLANLGGAISPNPTTTTDPKRAAGNEAIRTVRPGPIAALVIAAAFLILSLFGGAGTAPVARAQTQAGSGYQLAVQVTVQQPATQTDAYKMQLERDGQPLLTVPNQAPAQPGVLRAVFIAGTGAGPGQTQATLVVRDEQGAIVARKTEDWASLPPGGYSFGESLSLGLAGTTPGGNSGNTEDTAGHFLPQSGPVQAGLPTWATTALTSAGIAPLAQAQTSLALTSTAAGTNSKAATSNDQAPTQAQAQQMVMLHRNSPIPAFLGSFVMFGLAALLLIHLSQTGALPTLIAGWTAPRQPRSPKHPAALATATTAQGGVGTGAAPLPTNAPIFAPPPTTTATATLDPDEPEPAEEMVEETGASANPKAKRFGFALGRKAKTSKQQQIAASDHPAPIPATNETAVYEPVPPPDPTGAVVAGALNLAGLTGQAQAQEEDEDDQPPFENGAGSVSTSTQRQPDSADLAATATATAASANSTQTDWEFGLDLNGLGAANQGSPGLAGGGEVASLVIPRKLAASTLGASESRAQEQVARYIEQKGAALLQAEQVRVNLEYALRSAARLLGVEQAYHTLESRYADNGAALDILVEVERTFMLPAAGGKKTGAAARPTTIKKFVAVEVDGPHHQLPGRERRDRLKNAFLEKAGVVLVRVRPGEFAKLHSDLAYIGEVLWLDELKRSGQLTGKGQAPSQSGSVRLSRVEQGFSDDPIASKDKSWFVFAGGGGSKKGGRRSPRGKRGRS